MIPEEKLGDIKAYAAAGLSAADIAASVGMVPGVARVFVELADEPGSPVSQLLQSARAGADAEAVKALLKSAGLGDAESLKLLVELRERNRFNELIQNMDDDEYTP